MLFFQTMWDADCEWVRSGDGWGERMTENYRMKVREGAERVRATRHALTAAPTAMPRCLASRAACVRWDKPEPLCLGGTGWSRSTRGQLSLPKIQWRVVYTLFFLPQSLSLSRRHSLAFPFLCVSNTAYSLERSVRILPSNHWVNSNNAGGGDWLELAVQCNPGRLLCRTG